MSKADIVTCSFTMDRDIYNAYKSIISGKGENVKGNIIQYMMSVIRYETPNADTIAAIEEVKKMKADHTLGKIYDTADEMMQDLLDV